MKKQWKILCIGNSFSQDTTRLLANVAIGLGEERIKIVNLFRPGCSVRMHWTHAAKDMPAYRYEVNKGNGWMFTPNYRISQALMDEDWDWVSIQHGTTDGSFYTRPEDYDMLPKLIDYIRQHVSAHTQIAFNMTWVGEPEHKHREIRYYGGDQKLIYHKIADLTQQLLEPMAGIDRVCPTGTAIQNARTADVGILTRDGYHLGLGFGRYTAALAFWKALTGADIRAIGWAPEGVEAQQKQVAILAACSAVETPYAITML